MITLAQLNQATKLVRELVKLRVALKAVLADSNTNVTIQVSSFNAQHGLSLVIASAYVDRGAIANLIIPQITDIENQLVALGVDPT